MAKNSKGGWKRLPKSRFDEILADEVANLPPDALNIYRDHAITIVEQPCYRNEQYGLEHVFVVAITGARLLLFDDVEDEFAIGVADKDGILRNWNLYGELVFALRNLQHGAPSVS